MSLRLLLLCVPIQRGRMAVAARHCSHGPLEGGQSQKQTSCCPCSRGRGVRGRRQVQFVQRRRSPRQRPELKSLWTRVVPRCFRVPVARRTTTTRSSGGYQGGAFYGSPFGSMQFGAGFPGFAVPQNFPTLFQPQGQSPLPENPPPIYNQFQVSPTIPAPRVYPPLQSSEPTPGSVYSNPPPEPPG